MKLLFFIFFISLSSSHAQKFEVLWDNFFTKEVEIICGPQEMMCEEVCGSSASCLIKEGPCYNCIGTGLQMYHIFSQIGRSIQRQGSVGPQAMGELLRKGDFVTFTPQDAYNIIDAHNSIGVFKKFESLCPHESLSQMLFFQTDHQTRKLLSPVYLYCEFFHGSEFFKIEDKILIEMGLPIRLKRELSPFHLL